MALTSLGAGVWSWSLALDLVSGACFCNVAGPWSWSLEMVFGPGAGLWSWSLALELVSGPEVGPWPYRRYLALELVSISGPVDGLGP